MDDDDLLISNQFISDTTQNAGYGMTEQLRRFQLRQHVEQKQINMDEDADLIARERENALEGDILKTNPVLNEDMTTKELDHGRYVKEVRTALNINSIQREIYNRGIKIIRNAETGLYTRTVVDSDGVAHIQLYNADILNAEFVPGPDDVPRPYFTRPDGDIGKLTFRFPNPNYYILRLPRTFINVKSIRLLSVQIPHTFNSVNQYNNLILLDIKDNATNDSIPLKTGASPFKFILFQLTPGNYSLPELIAHIQTTVNQKVQEFSVDGFEHLFTVSFNANTGAINITLNQPPGRDLSFHWRFWFVDSLDGPLPITQFTNIWYLLGFSLPYEINADGSDKYVVVRTNLVDKGMNELIDGDVPDRPEFHVVVPYRFPTISPNNYIYLEIQQLGSIIDIQNPHSTNFKNQNSLFGKIIMDVSAGSISHSFDSTVKLFPNTLPLLDRLQIKWVDFAGLPVDFQMRDHSFTLEIIEYIDELDNVGYDSRRGTIDKTTYPDLVKYGGLSVKN